jgi:site-specific DNA recombinase
LTIVDEYVEPGRSALEMSKRAAFQRMLARIRDTDDIAHVIVYKLSRLARNRIDDAIVMADLRRQSVTLISATESVDDAPVGQLMHGILGTFNQYQSRESGADIAYKMGQKAATAAPSAAPASAISTTSTATTAVTSARSSSTPSAGLWSGSVSNL